VSLDGVVPPTASEAKVVNPTWTAHGISIGQVPQIVTHAMSLLHRPHPVSDGAGTAGLPAPAGPCDMGMVARSLLR
jgi:hypothetical protein